MDLVIMVSQGIEWRNALLATGGTDSNEGAIYCVNCGRRLDLVGIGGGTEEG